MSDPAPVLLSVSGAAARLGFSEQWLRIQTNRGVIPAVKDEKGRRLFFRAHIEKIIAERANGKSKPKLNLKRKGSGL